MHLDSMGGEVGNRITVSDLHGFVCLPTQVCNLDEARESVSAEYLRYALNELEREAPEALINAVSHGKRALHSRMDLLIQSLGMSPKHVPFPKKAEFCQRCGILAPRLLTKLNVLRNRVEHDYHRPDRGIVDDYVDVIALFIYATDRIVRSFVTEVDFINERHYPWDDCPGFEPWGWDMGASAKMLLGSGRIAVEARVLRTPMESIPADVDCESVSTFFKEHTRAVSFEVTLTDEDEFFEWASLFMDMYAGMTLDTEHRALSTEQPSHPADL